MGDVVRLLNSVGKQVFVDYYYDLKDLEADKKALAQKLLEQNPKATSIGGQLTRINCAHRIFANNLEKEALEIILNSNRLDENIIKKARDIISKEFNYFEMPGKLIMSRIRSNIRGERNY